MNVLLDTNILARLVEPTGPHHPVALAAVANLRLRGDVPCLVPQTFYELWVVSTRPLAANGRGRTPAEVAAEFAQLKSRFVVAADSSVVYDQWERLVTTLGVTGKPAHDARLVAAMFAHGITHLLTFNGTDFARYPGILLLDPQALAVAPPSSP